jgi:epoxyqueuosine reductase QueG
MELSDTTLITVCDKCFRACCWQGTFMCDESYSAGTVEKPVKELRKLGEEHSDYWLTDQRNKGLVEG